MKKLIIKSTTVKILDNDTQLEAVAGGGRRLPPRQPGESRGPILCGRSRRCHTGSPE